MTSRRSVPALLALLAGLWAAALPSVGAAALVTTGGSYKVSGTNFPVNFGPTSVTFDNSVHSLAGGQLNIQAKVTPINADAEWVEFIFSTPNGNAIAGNLNGFWNFTISDVPYSAPVELGAFIYYWTVDGQPVQNTKTWAGGFLFNDFVNPLGTNPIDGTQSPVFGAVALVPGPTFDPSLFITPFSFISTSVVGNNLDPSTVNGFHVASLIQRQNATVPEPGSVLAWSLLGLGLVTLASRRRRAHGPQLPPAERVL